MAYCRPETCHICGKEFSCMEQLSMEYTCGDCKEKLEKLKREQHFKHLDSLTIEQRIRKIEEWIYDYRPAEHPELRRY